MCSSDLYACALRASQLGLSVALIEQDKLGGTCLHRGCIPTKALLHAAEVADVAREGEAYGVRSSVAGIDMVKVNEYKDGVIGRLYKGLQGLVKSRDSITYIEGIGRLAAPNAVEVNGQRVEGRHVVLATGSYARSLPGLDIGGRIITSDQALLLDYVPASAIILGGGVIGVEHVLELGHAEVRGAGVHLVHLLHAGQPVAGDLVGDGAQGKDLPPGRAGHDQQHGHQQGQGGGEPRGDLQIGEHLVFPDELAARRVITHRTQAASQ